MSSYIMFCYWLEQTQLCIDLQILFVDKNVLWNIYAIMHTDNNLPINIKVSALSSEVKS